VFPPLTSFQNAVGFVHTQASVRLTDEDKGDLVSLLELLYEEGLRMQGMATPRLLSGQKSER
jgi:hypothetical protein